MPFGLRIRVGPRNHVLVGSSSPHAKAQFLGERTCPTTLCRELYKNGWTVLGCDLGGPKEACIRWGAHWHHLANTIELFMFGSSAAFLSNYFDHLLYSFAAVSWAIWSRSAQEGAVCSCTIKSRSSLLAQAHPDGPGKRAVKGCGWASFVHVLLFGPKK